MSEKNKKNIMPLILLILDGWGIAPPSRGNAITLAKTPTMNGLIKKYPYTEIKACGLNVGLPKGQDGNSEAGHMNLGAGRIVSQDAVVINKSIEDGSFFKNPAFIDAIRHAQINKSNIHLMGLVSGYQSAHSFPEHLEALLKLCRDNFKGRVFLHLFTDGRDAPQYESVKWVDGIKKEIHYLEKIVTISGRFYAMDRKKKWERTEKVYNALVLGEGIEDKDPISAISHAYNRGESDEFIQPTIISSKDEKGKQKGLISDNDSIIYFNLRSDRARELTKTFVQKDFNKKNPGYFKRKKILKNIKFIAMTDFGPDLDDILTAFPTKDLEDTLPIVLKDFKQLYISETEKYAHVTYFFNGGYANPVGGEERLMIPSPNVKSYDEKPEMSLFEVLKILRTKAINKYNFICVNFANPDMVGHTGNLKAGIKAVEFVDEAVKLLVGDVLKMKGTVLITSDHGNIEEMINLKTGEIDTKHSRNPVPFILVNDSFKGAHLNKGVLGDVAPTILDIMKLKKPERMRGKSLII